MEWINSIIHQLWPNIGHFTKKILSEKVEPKLQAKFDSMGISGFKFEKVDLGSIPPRITGIKVYDKNVSSSEIVMDLDLVLASDCDINFSLKNVTILQITNFSLRGLLRVVLKPLLTDMPLIGGFQYCFLSSPEIDYDLGGVANVVNMIPGLISNFLSIFFSFHSCSLILRELLGIRMASWWRFCFKSCQDIHYTIRISLILKNHREYQKFTI